MGLQNNPNKNLFIASGLTLFFITLTGTCVALTGKSGSFLLINGYHTPSADYFFRYYTYAGDGMMWVPVALYVLLINRKYILLVAAGILISTLLTHLLKRVIFAEDLRPIAHLAADFKVHIIEGVKMNRLHSFPSGHTAQAFTMALLLVYLFNKRPLAILLPCLALLVGYSRVYLGQHFVTDVLGGICIGLLSAVLSILLYSRFAKKTS